MRTQICVGTINIAAAGDTAENEAMVPAIEASLWIGFTVPVLRTTPISGSHHKKQI